MAQIDWPSSLKPCKEHPPPNSVGIVMPVRDSLKFFKLAFYSILSFTDYPYMLTVVDNMSGIKTRMFMNIQSKNHNIHILTYQSDFNYAAEINLGINYLFANPNVKYGLVINSDVVVEPHWLTSLVNSLSQKDGVGIVGPMTNAATRVQEGPRETKTALVNYVSGFCMMFKREIWEKLGGFDEGYVGGFYEDRDFCHRASKLGYKTAVNKEVYLHHYWGATRRFDLESDKSMVRNRKRFFEKFPELTKHPAQIVNA